ncbi:division initiation protein [Streptomyces laurentii]|uniref:Division initiation protein n=2 Tax=Streptomyces laurentii TaxID=39478 RepID=A0A169N4V4_STRLU|nr:division initiation protein [Streptomyces laurentii]
MNETDATDETGTAGENGENAPAPVGGESGGKARAAGNGADAVNGTGAEGARMPDESPAPRRTPPHLAQRAQPLPEPRPAQQPPRIPPQPLPDPGTAGRQRLVAALWPPRVTRAQLVVALLLFVLGLGLAIQVRSTSDNSALRGARQEDLVRILDELDDRTQRLEDEKTRLEKQRSELESSSDQAEEARKQTREKERQLGILAGTVAAEGPGITLTITDAAGAVESDMLLDAIQELRAAGAEAIQVNDVRVVADSFFSGSGRDMRIDGTVIAAPYVFKVIGKPEDLEPALNIPGGIVQTLEKEQATAAVERSEKIVVDALRPAKRPDYAQSSSQ